MGESEHIITPESPGTPVSAPFILRPPGPRTLSWYYILEPELTNLTTSGAWFTLNLGGLGIAAGAFISFGITLRTVHLDEKLNALFAAFEVVAGVFLLYFAIGIVINLRRLREQIRVITQRETRG